MVVIYCCQDFLGWKLARVPSIPFPSRRRIAPLFHLDGRPLRVMRACSRQRRRTRGGGGHTRAERAPSGRRDKPRGERREWRSDRAGTGSRGLRGGTHTTDTPGDHLSCISIIVREVLIVNSTVLPDEAHSHAPSLSVNATRAESPRRVVRTCTARWRSSSGFGLGRGDRGAA